MINEIAGYKFKNPEFLETALTHTSFSNEKKVESNQRLEFLGDSVIGLVIGEYIYKTFPAMPEGELSKIRAGIVCEKALVKCAEKINLSEKLKVGKGEEMGGGRTRASNLEDAFEAVIGAIYLDSNLETVKKIILDVMCDIIKDTVSHDGIEDSKTALQEYVQKKGQGVIEYRLDKEEGPDHNKLYTMSVYINGEKGGTGTGRSKKMAEQNAAGNALSKFKI